MTYNLTEILPYNLKIRLDLIIQTVPKFWNQRLYNHFTNHGIAQSEQVYQKLTQLIQELPTNQSLTSNEAFIISAATWLYEVGMQSPNLKPILDFDPVFGMNLSFSQLQEIRANKHLLTERLIKDSASYQYKGPPLQLGFTAPIDQYVKLIAEVCRWCSEEPLKNVPEERPIKGEIVRVRFLVALLRLADQLYIEATRVNQTLLRYANLPSKEFVKWCSYLYTQTLPIQNGQIRFHYSLPIIHKEYLGYIRELIEPNFVYDNNPSIQYLWDKHGLRLMLNNVPSLNFDDLEFFPFLSDLFFEFNNQNKLQEKNFMILPPEVTVNATSFLFEIGRWAASELKERWKIIRDQEATQQSEEVDISNPNEQNKQQVHAILQNLAVEHGATEVKNILEIVERKHNLVAEWREMKVDNEEEYNRQRIGRDALRLRQRELDERIRKMMEEIEMDIKKLGLQVNKETTDLSQG